jgi:hypothetical protein
VNVTRIKKREARASRRGEGGVDEVGGDEKRTRGENPKKRLSHMHNSAV